MIKLGSLVDYILDIKTGNVRGKNKKILFLRRALAKQINCLCPTDKLSPPSLTYIDRYIQFER